MKREADFYNYLRRLRPGVYTASTLLGLFTKFETISQLEKCLFHNDLSNWKKLGHDYQLLTNEANAKGPFKRIYGHKRKPGRKPVRPLFHLPDEIPGDVALKNEVEPVLPYPELGKELSELCEQLKIANKQSGYFILGKPRLPERLRQAWPVERLLEAVRALIEKGFLEQDKNNPSRLIFIK